MKTLVKILNFKRFGRCLGLGGLFVAAAVCAQDEYLSEDELFGEDVLNGSGISDPLEPLNRAIFQFNDFVYIQIFDRVGEFYTTVTPQPVRTGATNFFNNLNYPVRLAGNLLQARFANAWIETERFLINSTVGIAGTMRPVDTIERFAPIPKEDVGQALGSWGIGNGPYLVLPLWGPSTLRDLAGLIGDRAANPVQKPFSAIDHWKWEYQAALASAEVVARLTERYGKIKESQIDAYGALKNGYVQHRDAAVAE